MQSKSPFEGLTLTKGMWLVVAVTAMGIITILMQHTGRQQVSDQFILTTKLLNENARSSCSEVLKKHFGTDLGLPDDSISDGDKKVTLKWRASEGKYGTVDCNYVLDQGVVALNIDGKVVATN